MPILASMALESREGLPEEPELEVIERTADHVLASWRHFLFVVWQRYTTLGAVHTMKASLGVLTRRCRRPVDLLIVAEETAAAPSAEVRGPIADMLKVSRLSRCGVVLEGDGFRAAALRAFATGVGLVARPPFPYRPFATVADAAAWFEAKERGETPAVSAAIIERAVRIARGK